MTAISDTCALSVLVPVYNVAKWLPRFVQALHVQAADIDLELVFIDDASTDGSWDALGRELSAAGLESRSKRVRHETNAGVCTTRQELLDLATGKYVVFADSDDWMEPGMFAALADAAERSGADLVWEDYYDDYGTQAIRRDQRVACEADVLLEKTIDGSMHGALWNKVFRRSFLCEHADVIAFPKPGIPIMEDKCFLASALSCGPKVRYVPSCHYHYCHANVASATRSVTPAVFETMAQVAARMEQLVKTEGQKSALHRLKQGQKLMAAISPEMTDRVFRAYHPEVTSLRGYSASAGIGLLFWMATHGMRLVAIKGYGFLNLIRRCRGDAIPA